MYLNNHISQLYRKFSEAEGNQHIASEYAIEKLIELVDKFRITDVLEVGLGIGSIAGILLSLNKTNLNYIGTEANEFCLKALSGNLKGQYQRLTVKNNLNEISLDQNLILQLLTGKIQDWKF